MRDHVFVCYARKDEQFVLQLAGHLKESGVPIWLDQWDIPAGANWDRSIDDAIYECNKFLIVLSPSAVDSPEVLAELRTALDEKKQIVPVIQSTCRIPRQLRTIQYVDFSSCGPNDEATLKRLLRTLPVAAAARVAQQVGPSVNIDQMRVGEERSESDQDTTQNILIKPGTVFRDTLKDGSQGPEMIVIPAGEFRMGDTHAVTVNLSKPFALGKFQITFDEYDAFARATKTRLPKDQGWGRGRRPVIHVSWKDAQACAKWLSEQTGKCYRLPSESEWEYAARSGGKDDVWAGTSNDKELAEFAWFRKNSGRKTQEVGTKKANGLGLHDMSGNVWEWIEDCWHSNIDAPKDGSAWGKENGGQCGQRVLRGGSWINVPELLRSSSRGRDFAGNRNYDFGFRLAQNLS